MIIKALAGASTVVLALTAGSLPAHASTPAKDSVQSTTHDTLKGLLDRAATDSSSPAGSSEKSESKRADARTTQSKRIGAFALFDGNYTDIFRSCGDIERGSLTSSSGAALWSSTDDLCAFGTVLALPAGTTEWRLTFEGIDECRGNTWAFTIANPSWEVVDESSTARFPTNYCGSAQSLTTKWTQNIYNGSAYFTIFTDAFIAGLYFNSVLLEYKTSGSNPDPGPSPSTSVVITCNAGPVDGKPGIICAGITSGLTAGTRLTVSTQLDGKGQWKNMPRGHQPVLIADGTFSWAMSVKRARSASVVFAAGNVKSNVVRVTF